MLRGQFLGLLAIEVLEIGGCDLCGAVASCDHVNDGHRRLGEDAEAWIDDFEVFSTKFFEDQMGFIFPGDQDITELPLCKSDGGSPGSGVEYCGIIEDTFDQFLGGRFAAEFLKTKTPGRKVTPTRPPPRSLGSE